MDKTAVDKASADYWTTYFKDYGRAWVRTIPRRIKTAMVNTKDLAIKTAEGGVKPLAYNATADGLSIEAAFSGKVDGKDASFLVMTEFDKDGKMLKFEATRVV